ncbi:UDP-N-acetylhexosamine pyrophosphorylase-like isoform X2 [Lineus longissimus]|uniref:UDP-N-acetylhexosamine pyrophosphorylase-like isoform X2 n=1 Tax=Lineus longissimus TaxID=88925 RepID=UPI00315C74A8
MLAKNFFRCHPSVLENSSEPPAKKLNFKMDYEQLKTKLKSFGQEHLLEWWSSLPESEQKELYADLCDINFAQVDRYFKRCNNQLNTTQKVDENIEPVPKNLCGSISRTEKETLEAYENEGFRLISEGKVAVLLLAGGQGTRLGVPYPKGMYDVGLPSGKTLYHLQAERICRMQTMAKEKMGKAGIIPWYIMTSEKTKEPTHDYFANHDYFGLSKDNMVLFEQFQLPCLTFDGKIILDQPHKVARAPDGNGGLYRALGDCGIIDDMESRGIEHINVYCVDNILVKMADPVFTGFCHSIGADCGAKVAEKAFPTEPVGVVCRVDGLYKVVEYSEISLETAERRNPDGQLTFNAGNICNHYFSINFLKDMVYKYEDKLHHHVAKKKIPFVDKNMCQQKPTQPNGIKMEKFVFDVFQFSKKFAVWEVLREDEFSPLKNADGADKDTPTTARLSVSNLHRRFVLRAGGKFIRDDGTVIPDIPSQRTGEPGDDPIVCEISPLISFAGENLEHIVAKKEFIPPLEITTNKKGGFVIRSGQLC